MRESKAARGRKTLGGSAADLLAHFSVREPPTSTVEEAAQHLATSAPTVRVTLHRLLRQGWISRLRRGVYEISPSWSQPDAPYTPERYSALAQWLKPPYYVGFRSAFELHNALLQPVVNRVYVVVPRQRRTISSTAEPVVWVTFRSDRFEWGLTKQWFGARALFVSDWERTVLDSLHLPRLAGGVGEVASIIARNPERLDGQRLVDYAKRYSIATVTRRIGWLLEQVHPDSSEPIAGALHASLPPVRGNPPLLDPALPPAGATDRRWGLRINLSGSDLVSALTT